MVSDDHPEQAILNRREFFIRLSAVSLMIASGCAIFRRRSELDTAFAELDTLLNQYTASVESSIDAYIEASLNRYVGAPELIERLEPLDKKRTRTLQKVIKLRQSLIQLLSDEQWEVVFD